jgi:hypothetical protein
MRPGTKFEGEIQEKLKTSHVCLALLTKSFLASEYCQNEIGYAEAHGVAFLPCKLDDCKPKGFLASRGYLDLSQSEDWEFEDSLRWDLADKALELLKSLQQEGLRAELLDFFERSLRLASDTATFHPLRSLQVNHRGLFREAREETTEQSHEEFVKVVRGIIDYLRDGKPMDALFPTLGGASQGYNDCLPAWRLRTSALTQFEPTTQFQAAPDFILRETLGERGDVIEASVSFLMKYDYQGDGYYQNHFAEKKDTLYHLSTLLPTMAYQSVYAGDMYGIGWGRENQSQSELILIPSRGIYRLGLVSKESGAGRIVLTKYLGISGARMKLGISTSAHGEPASSVAKTGDEALGLSPVLELMYLGFSGSYARGGELSFLLYNNSKSIAIVRSMDVMIHRVVPRSPQPPPLPGAMLKEYRYRVTLHPRTGRVRATSDSFKYAPGEVDKFILELRSAEQGFDYEISVVIEWMDIGTGKLMTLETPREVVEFPLYQGKHR